MDVDFRNTLIGCVESGRRAGSAASAIGRANAMPTRAISSARACLPNELFHGGNDVGGVYTGGVEQLVGLAGAGHRVNGELRHSGQRTDNGLLLRAAEGFEHGV